MTISDGWEPLRPKAALISATLTAMAGLGYIFWRLLEVVQSWAAATPFAAQILQ